MDESCIRAFRASGTTDLPWSEERARSLCREADGPMDAQAPQVLLSPKAARVWKANLGTERYPQADVLLISPELPNGSNAEKGPE